MGRCLSYGKGITYWPVREIVAQATGDRSVRELLDGTADADAVAERIESAIGASVGGAVNEEIFWALRKLVEALARETPLVLVFEDIHWGEPTLLDLIEHLADWVRDVGVLVICLARPELLDRRPTWGGGKLNAASVLLDPLSDEESSELMGRCPRTQGSPRRPARASPRRRGEIRCSSNRCWRCSRSAKTMRVRSRCLPQSRACLLRGSSSSRPTSADC